MKKLITLIVLFTSTVVSAGTLVVNSNQSGESSKAAFDAYVDAFRAAHPEVTVVVNEFEHEAYKTAIRNFLTAEAPDVAIWFAGNRMKFFVDQNLFQDVSDVWADAGLNDSMASTKGSLTVDGKQYGVPWGYYQWGVYYRKDLFDNLGLNVPRDWEEFKWVCAMLKKNGITPITIGTKYLWTAGGWFDYLNSRTHGYDFHIQLATGKVAWTDDRVRQTFANWRQLIDMGAFIDDHQSMSWQEALPFMIDGKAAAYLMGNFAVAPLRAGGLSDDQLDFYQFPVINPNVDYAEDAPTDTFHIASGAQNVEAAKAFLLYVTSPDVQTEINSGDALGQLPVNAKASVSDDKFIQQGFDMLSNNAGGGIMQFFDRDFPAEMASVGMEGLQEFMVFPDNLDDILERLEDARQRIYN